MKSKKKKIDPRTKTASRPWLFFSPLSIDSPTRDSLHRLPLVVELVVELVENPLGHSAGLCP